MVPEGRGNLFHLPEIRKRRFMKKVKSNYYRAVFIFLLIVTGFVALPMRAFAAEPELRDILITNDKENVLLYARLVNGFKPDMELAVLNGISATFVMDVEVYQERFLTWDKKIYSQEIRRTVKYDNLKKTFSVSFGNKKDPLVFTDIESAQKAMSDFNGIVAVPLSLLSKGKNYHALIKIKMDKARLPLHMEYVFFFVSFWDFETSLYRQNFSY
jgi:hypothetical protein